MFDFYDPQWEKVDAGGFFNVPLGPRSPGGSYMHMHMIDIVMIWI